MHLTFLSAFFAKKRGREGGREGGRSREKERERERERGVGEAELVISV